MSRLPHLSLTTVLLCVAAIAIGYLAITTTRYFVHNYQLRGQESQMRVELQQLDHDHAQLIAVRDYLKSDEYIQQVARRSRPGASRETLVVVSQADTVPTATPPRAGETTPGEPWWKSCSSTRPRHPRPNPAVRRISPNSGPVIDAGIPPSGRRYRAWGCRGNRPRSPACGRRRPPPYSAGCPRPRPWLRIGLESLVGRRLLLGRQCFGVGRGRRARLFAVLRHVVGALAGALILVLCVVASAFHGVSPLG